MSVREKVMTAAAIGMTGLASLFLSACAVDTTKTPPPATRPAATDKTPAASANTGALNKNYAKIFLTPADLGKDYNVAEEKEGNLSDQPKTYQKYKGEYSGIKVLLGDELLPIQRVVDIRWVFPDAKMAQKFLDETQTLLSEGAGPVRDAKSPGAGGKVYGGVNHVALKMRAGVFYHYYYIFREGRCVVKVYGSEGRLSKGHPTPALMLPIAEKAAAHCKGF